MRAGIAIALMTACGGGNTPAPDASNEGLRTTVVEVPATASSGLDVLFVVDDSGSMADKQTNLINNFPNFINKLGAGPAGLPDLHLGVITTDMGTKASGSPTPGPGIGQIGQGGCASTGRGGKLTVGGAPVTGTFISDIRLGDGTRQTNYTGELANVFGEMARVGTAGCGFEQPLASMRAALDNNPANTGFLRPEALLAVVFLSDEDDCSVKDPAFFSNTNEGTLGPLQSFRCTRFGVTCGIGGTTPAQMNQVGTKDDCTANVASDLVDSVEDYRDFLVNLKSDPSRVIVSSIMGAIEPVAVELRTINGTSQTALAHSCQFQGNTGPQVADPGVRFKSFTDLFPERNAFASICQEDLSGALDLIGQLVTSSIGSPCLTQPIADVEPGTPGVQVDCIVEDLVGGSATVIPECDFIEARPCWKLESDPGTCPSEPRAKLVVLRGLPPDPATVTRMRCIVE